VLPSEFSEVRGVDSISLRRMFREHLDMQFVDVRVLLRLPKSGLPAGGNFATAAVLFNLLSGFSVCLYNAGPASITERGTSAKRFKGMLRSYFPWNDLSVRPKTGADVLYQFARNPLAHALGLDVENAPDIAIGKAPLSERRILELEDSVTRPAWAPTALSAHQAGYEIGIAGLYWGLHRLLHGLLRDPAQRQGAEALARELYF
jgi:hypothetical protein